MSKRDDLTDLYKKSEITSIVGKFLFVANIILACIAFAFSSTSWFDVIIIVELIVSLLFAATDILDEVWFLHDAQRERRKSFLSNSLGTDLSEYKTDGYYNNNHNPSVIKMGINCFENVFFSKNLAAKRALLEFCKALSCILLFILSCILVKDINIILVISQFIFSGILFFNAIRSLAFNIQVKQLYERFRNEFIVSGINTDNQLIIIIDCVMEYECLKSSSHIMLSNKVFNKNNPDWSSTWLEMEKEIVVNEKVEKLALLHFRLKS